MTETQTTLLLESLMQALETMAFVTLLPVEGSVDPAPELRSAYMEFNHGRPGGLRILAPAAFGAMLAGNMLGVPSADPQAIAAGDDALRELVNVTCGNVLHAHCANLGQEFRMGLPSVVPVESPRIWDEVVARRSVQVLDADGFPIAVELTGLD